MRPFSRVAGVGLCSIPKTISTSVIGYSLGTLVSLAS
jgi:hypothetical protein